VRVAGSGGVLHNIGFVNFGERGPFLRGSVPMCQKFIPVLKRAFPATLAIAVAMGTGTAFGQTPPKQDSAKPTAVQAPPTVQPVKPIVPGAGQPVVQPGAHGAMPGATPPPELTKDLPKFTKAGVVFDTPNYNFGRVMAGGNVTHEYWFTNPGKEKLQILAVQPGCGCTTTGAWDREVPPGESGRIPISVATGKFSGHIAKVVTVTTNCEEARSVQLKIE